MNNGSGVVAPVSRSQVKVTYTFLNGDEKVDTINVDRGAGVTNKQVVDNILGQILLTGGSLKKTEDGSDKAWDFIPLAAMKNIHVDFPLVSLETVAPASPRKQ